MISCSDSDVSDVSDEIVSIDLNQLYFDLQSNPIRAKQNLIDKTMSDTFTVESIDQTTIHLYFYISNEQGYIFFNLECPVEKTELNTIIEMNPGDIVKVKSKLTAAIELSNEEYQNEINLKTTNCEFNELYTPTPTPTLPPTEPKWFLLPTIIPTPTPTPTSFWNVSPIPIPTPFPTPSPTPTPIIFPKKDINEHLKQWYSTPSPTSVPWSLFPQKDDHGKYTYSTKELEVGTQGNLYPKYKYYQNPQKYSEYHPCSHEKLSSYELKPDGMGFDDSESLEFGGRNIKGSELIRICKSYGFPQKWDEIK